MPVMHTHHISARQPRQHLHLEVVELAGDQWPIAAHHRRAGTVHRMEDYAVRRQRRLRRPRSVADAHVRRVAVLAIPRPAETRLSPFAAPA